MILLFCGMKHLLLETTSKFKAMLLRLSVLSRFSPFSESEFTEMRDNQEEIKANVLKKLNQNPELALSVYRVVDGCRAALTQAVKMIQHEDPVIKSVLTLPIQEAEKLMKQFDDY